MSVQTNSSQNVRQAAIAIVFSSFILGFTDNLVILLADDMGLWQFHVLRGLTVLILLFLQAIIMRARLLPKNWGAVLFRGFCQTIAILLFFGALPITGAAVAGAGMFTAPIFVLIFSVLLFGESIGLYRVLAVFVGSIGAVMVLNLTSGAVSLFAIMPILAGAYYATNNIATRRICADETPQSLLFIYTVMITSFSAIMATYLGSLELPADVSEDVLYLVRGWEPVSWYNLGFVGINGIGAFAALLAMTWGYQQAETSYVAIYEYSYLIFAGFFGWLLWRDMLSFTSVAGIILIIFAGAIITLRTGKGAE